MKSQHESKNTLGIAVIGACIVTYVSMEVLQILAEVNGPFSRLRQAGDLARAGKCEEANNILTKKYRHNDESVFSSIELGHCYETQHDYASAERAYRFALDEAREVAVYDQVCTRQALSSLGLFYCRRGMPDRAEPLLKEAIEIKKSAPNNQLMPANEENDLALCYDSLGRAKEADSLYFTAMLSGVQTHLDKAALAAFGKGDWQLAVHLYKRAVDLREHSGRTNPAVMADMLRNTAKAYGYLHQQKQCEKFYQKIERLFEVTQKYDQPRLKTYLNEYAEMLRKQGRIAEADKVIQHIAQFEFQQPTAAKPPEWGDSR